MRKNSPKMNENSVQQLELSELSDFLTASECFERTGENEFQITSQYNASLDFTCLSLHSAKNYIVLEERLTKLNFIKGGKPEKFNLDELTVPQKILLQRLQSNQFGISKRPTMEVIPEEKEHIQAQAGLFGQPKRSSPIAIPKSPSHEDQMPANV